MSAFAQKSDGIADTHLHWDEVEQEIQSALGTKATFGSEKSFKNIGEGNGMLSRTCLINPDWQNVSEDLPKAFVLKICTPITAIEFSSHLNGTEATAMAECVEQACTRVHNNEIDTYNLLNKYSDGRIPLPKIYASRKFDEVNTLKGFLIMEYFDELTPYHYTNNVTIDAVKQCLRSVAIWEGIGERFTDEERSTFTTKYLSETFGDMYKEDMLREMKNDIKNMCGPEHEETINEFFDNLKSFIGKSFYEKMDNMPDTLGMKRVFCHGDLWSANILWSKVNENVNVKAHIDFQISSFACVAVDISRLLCSTLSGADRRKHWKELLETFYGYLKEEVEGEMPYTYEQLEESYKIFIPLVAALIVPFVPSIMKYLKQINPEVIISDHNIIEKLVALMEDSNIHWKL